MKNKIGFVLGTNGIGGTETQTFKLIKYLEENNFVVYLFFLDRYRFNKEKIDYGKTKTIYLYNINIGPLQFFSKLFFSTFLKYHSINIIHILSTKDIVYYSRIYQLKNITCFLSIRNMWMLESGNFKEEIEIGLKNSYKVICNSFSIQNTMKTLGYDTKKVQVIYNTVDVPNGLSINTRTKKRILYCGSLKPIKGSLDFVYMANIISKKQKDIEFWVIGDGILKKEMEKLVKEFGIAHLFTFFGHIPNNEIPYNDCDIFVSTSLSEGSSNSIIEACSYGLGVVATDIPASTEILEGKDFGALAPVGNYKSMAEKSMLFLNQKPNEAIERREKGIKFVKDYFSKEQTLKKYLLMYKKILS